MTRLRHVPVDAASSARVGAGLSTSTKGILGAQDALALALDPLEGARADVVALFISPQFEDEIPRIVELAGERAEDAVIVGCSAGGVLGGDVEVEDAPAVAAWAASLPSTGVQPFRLTFEHDGDQGVIDGLDELPSADRGAVVVMLSDPFSFPADVFLGHLNDNAPGVPVLGGQASGGLEAGRNVLIANGEVVRDGAVGVILTGPSVGSWLVSQGCRPIGETFAVTRAERNVMHELAGAPAMRRLEEVYAAAGPRDQLLMRRGLHVGQAISELKPRLDRGDFLIRNVMGIDPKTGSIAITDIAEVGQTVQFQVRDADSAREDLKVMLERERAADDRRVIGALLFSCNGRGQALFGQPHHDIGALRSAFGDVPVAGFFAAGELGPIGGRNFLHGFTASVLLIKDGAAPG
ncbi:MAG: FIST C-terminal domain-containing protein [Chloroflexota bacterium]|nr:FIST C-terminal domain-containing protein [Chloroflexota bacterium]